jgi:molybdenum cofactor synthesis domain-containing protein
MTTVAAIIIGDEILTGKVRDANTPLLIDFFAELGIDLERVAVIADDQAQIAAEVAFCSERFDVVLTSGGVGPTHDDCTVHGVADAFGVEVVRHPDIEEMIRAWWGERFTESALRMADMPEGSRLFYGDDGLLPLVVFENVYLFPGVPRLFAAKLPSLRAELSGTPKTVNGVYLNSDESRIAPLVGLVADECPKVKVGSYPRFGEGKDHRLWISIEGIDAEEVSAATDRLLELLEGEEIVRVDRPDLGR